MAKVQLHIRGRVQGVAYRISAQQRAHSLSLHGWVKNLPDGSVFAEASGPLDSIESFIAWCRRGPAGASVTSVDVDWLNRDEKVGAADLGAEIQFRITG